ncbi:MAG: hypothetical protein DRO11_05970, partial [Methanobacteriota archaeon]
DGVVWPGPWPWTWPSPPGDPDHPIPIIFSAGNEGSRGYGSIMPPGGTAKNTIVVGSIDSNTRNISGFSSRGPTDDGRTKPDVVAAGCETPRNDSNPNQTIWSTWPPATYGGMCGTSMAAPAVSGVVADILEALNTYPGGLTVRPSLIKALLAHTADKYMVANSVGGGVTNGRGHGVVDASMALQLIHLNHASPGVYIHQANINQGEIHTYTIPAPPNIPWYNVLCTLAWDDYPGSTLAAQAIVNDLDIAIQDAAGIWWGHFQPSSTSEDWTAYGSPSLAAALNFYNDHVNNLVAAGIYSSVCTTPPCSYTVVVRGTTVPQAPQAYDLICTAFSELFEFEVEDPEIEAKAGQDVYYKFVLKNHNEFEYDIPVEVLDPTPLPGWFAELVDGYGSGATSLGTSHVYTVPANGKVYVYLRVVTNPDAFASDVATVDIRAFLPHMPAKTITTTTTIKTQALVELGLCTFDNLSQCEAEGRFLILDPTLMPLEPNHPAPGTLRYPVRVTHKGNSNDTIDLFAEIYPPEDVPLPAWPAGSPVPNWPNHYINPGPFPSPPYSDPYVGITCLPKDDWEAKFHDPDPGDTKYQVDPADPSHARVTLNPGESFWVYVDVTDKTVYYNATIDRYLTEHLAHWGVAVQVRGVSRNGDREDEWGRLHPYQHSEDTIGLGMQLEEINHLELSWVGYTPQTVDPGDYASFELDLDSYGNTIENLILSYAIDSPRPEGWTVKFFRGSCPGTEEIHGLKLNPLRDTLEDITDGPEYGPYINNCHVDPLLDNRVCVRVYSNPLHRAGEAFWGRIIIQKRDDDQGYPLAGPPSQPPNPEHPVEQEYEIALGSSDEPAVVVNEVYGIQMEPNPPPFTKDDEWDQHQESLPGHEACYNITIINEGNGDLTGDDIVDLVCHSNKPLVGGPTGDWYVALFLDRNCRGDPKVIRCDGSVEATIVVPTPPDLNNNGLLDDDTPIPDDDPNLRPDLGKAYFSILIQPHFDHLSPDYRGFDDVLELLIQGWVRNQDVFDEVLLENDVQQVWDLELSPEIQAGTMDPLLRSYTFTINITNRGNTEDVADLSWEWAPGTSCVDAWSVELSETEIWLRPGETKQFEVTITDTGHWNIAGSQTEIIIKAESRGSVEHAANHTPPGSDPREENFEYEEDAVSLKIVMGEHYAKESTLVAVDPSGLPEENALYELTITNLGNTSDAYDINAWVTAGSPDHVLEGPWAIWIPNPSGMSTPIDDLDPVVINIVDQDNDCEIDPDEIPEPVVVPIEVHIPRDALCSDDIPQLGYPEAHRFWLTVKSLQNPELFNQHEAELVVEPTIGAEVELWPLDPDSAHNYPYDPGISSGETYYLVTVHNPTNCTTSYRLTGWVSDPLRFVET